MENQLTTTNVSVAMMVELDTLKSIVNPSIQDCFTSTTLQTCRHNKEALGKYALSVIGELVELIEYYQVKHKIGQNQLWQLWDVLSVKYPDLSVADYRRFKISVWSGGIDSPYKSYVYERLYDRIDGEVIMGWLRTYVEYRIDEREHAESQRKATYSKGKVAKIEHLTELIKSMEIS